jgi:transcriptional regulator with XRE-family HTH domain
MNEPVDSSGPGETLRSVRRSNNWTLAEVAARAGIALSTLSKIEIGQISPTYEQLMRLSASLNIDVAELFTRRGKDTVSVPTGGRRSINRLNVGEVIETDTRVQRYLSTDMLNKQVTPIVSEVRARSLEEFGEFMHHPGEEFLYVIEGRLALYTDAYAPVILEPGESSYFESAMGHAYVAHECERVRFLCICTVPAESRNSATPSHSVSAPALQDNSGDRAARGAKKTEASTPGAGEARRAQRRTTTRARR